MKTLDLVRDEWPALRWSPEGRLVRSVGQGFVLSASSGGVDLFRERRVTRGSRTRAVEGEYVWTFLLEDYGSLRRCLRAARAEACEPTVRWRKP